MWRATKWGLKRARASLGAAAFLLLGALPAQASAKLAHPFEFTLARVAEMMNLELRPGIAPPALQYQSTTPLKKFQDTLEPQWGFRPDAFTNAYSWGSNEIFLMDDEAYYQTEGRCIDDSLAHELVHFFQVRYRGYDLTKDEFAELEAVDLQTRYRAQYCR